MEEQQQLTIREQKQHAKANLIKRLEYLNKKIENLYINNQLNGKPLLYPLSKEIIVLYKTIEYTAKILKEELEKERQE